MSNKRSKINSFLTESLLELRSYNKTKRFVKLSQACEKVWVAFTLLMELKSGIEIKKHATTREIAFRMGFEQLYKTCFLLHVIHYEGSPAITDEETSEDILDAVARIKKIMRSH